MINAFNLPHMVSLMEHRLADVQAEIADVRGLLTEEEYDKQCQVYTLFCIIEYLDKLIISLFVLFRYYYIVCLEIR